MTCKRVGSFKVTSGKLVVTDPCYELGTWCSGQVTARKGTWNAYVSVTADANTALLACHKDVTDCQGSAGWKEAGFVVGVDSGQAGVFDAKHYRNVEDAKAFKYPKGHVPIVPDDPWYSMCCALTLSSKDLATGIVPGGVVTSSGYGDGSYEAFVRKDKDGNVVAVKIVFVPDEDVDSDLDSDVDEGEDDDDDDA